MDINTLLQQNEPPVSLLLRRYRVSGSVNIDTINQAHRLHGAPFMTQLMAILTPSSNFTNIADMLNPGGFIDTAVRAQQQAEASNKGKFWSFWDNLLSRVDSTGKTIGQFKYDAAGMPVYNNIETQRQKQTQKMVLIIAGVLVIGLIAFLIFKKKG